MVLVGASAIVERLFSLAVSALQIKRINHSQEIIVEKKRKKCFMIYIIFSLFETQDIKQKQLKLLLKEKMVIHLSSFI